MAIKANVVDGSLDYSYTKQETTSMGSDLGYDQFLQLLCAEMQYQDPLEPTSNTDYVAQMATFSQLEATLSLAETQQDALASSLVGKQVILAVEDDKGAVNYVEGRVDYVTYENGETFLSVKDRLYPLSSLDTVADDSYYDAASKANEFKNMMDQFPEVDNLTTGYSGALKEAREYYDNLTDYEKEFVDQDVLATLQTLEERMSELEKAEGGNSGSGESDRAGSSDGSGDANE